MLVFDTWEVISTAFHLLALVLFFVFAKIKHLYIYLYIMEFIYKQILIFPSTQDALSNDMRNLSLTGHVGFDSLPDQLVNKATSQGFCFNILCIGETGLGKSTLMNTLFNTNFESKYFCLLVGGFSKVIFMVLLL